MEKLTLQEAVDYSLDDGNYPDVIPVDYGSDFKLKEHPEYYPVIKDPRKVEIEVSSYRGICCGARHYYAEIHADGVSICSKDSDGKVYSHCGYLGEEFRELERKNRGKYNSIYNIKVCRTVTQEEIDADPSNWEFTMAGDNTNRFNKKEEAIERAKQIIEARFGKGWLFDETTGIKKWKNI